MTTYQEKLDKCLFNYIKAKDNIKILEFGVRQGESTKKFIEICEKNNGHLYSVDINDCSNVSKSKYWTFLKSRDDNFDYLNSQIPQSFDYIFLDSFHNADHIEKIFYYYFKKLKVGGTFFIDDISWIPYVSDNYRNSFNCEMNNKETFNTLLSIYRSNSENIEIYFSFIDSGLARVVKLNDNKINLPKKIVSRSFSLKNIIRKILT